jgi:hypothetical protein
MDKQLEKIEEKLDRVLQELTEYRNVYSRFCYIPYSCPDQRLIYI